MKFDYQYRTPDNKQHVGVIKAASKDAAYAALKAQGIKPGRVVESPGFFNNLFGKGKRWIAICVLAALLLMTLVSLKLGESAPQTEVRSQIYGDPSVVEHYEVRGWWRLFDDVGDRFLSRFAQPGQPIPPELTASADVIDALRAVAGCVVRVPSDDPEEIQKMKRIVNGMRVELGEYLKAGGSVEGYVERLVERQRVEVRIVYHARKDTDILERAGKTRDRERLVEEWNAKNETLRELGIRTIPLPRDW